MEGPRIILFSDRPLYRVLSLGVLVKILGSVSSDNAPPSPQVPIPLWILLLTE